MCARVVSAVLLFSPKNPEEIPRVPFSSQDDVTSFMQIYHLHQDSALLPHLVDALEATGFLRNNHAIPFTAAFFSEIFAANPKTEALCQRPTVQKNGHTRTALTKALTLTREGGVLALGGYSGELNDQYWGAFFASGKTVFLERLVEQLAHWDQREDRNMFLIAASAKWSLARYSHSQPYVREELEKMRPRFDQRTQKIIADLLRETPEAVKEEIRGIVQQQRDASLWGQDPPQVAKPASQYPGDPRK